MVEQDEAGPVVTRAPRPYQDPLVLACAVLAGLALGWFGLNLLHPVGPRVLLWIAAPLLGPLLSVIFWQAGDAPAMGPVNRRFWRLLSPVPILVACGQAAQAVDVLRYPDVGGPHTTPAVLAFHAPALLLVLLALAGPGSRDKSRDRAGAVRTLLDAATVMIATAAFIWHFVTRQSIGELTAGSRVAAGAMALSLVLIVAASSGIFIMARLLLSEHRLIDRTALRLLGVAVAFAILAPTVQELVFEINADLYVVQISIPITFLCGALAGAYQRRAVPTLRRRRARTLRSFSLLPYTAVAAVDLLLLWVAGTDRRRHRPGRRHRGDPDRRGGLAADQRAAGQRPAARPSWTTAPPTTR